MVDSSRLPAELVPFAAALALAPARPLHREGWRAPSWPAPCVPLIPGDPPYDGVFRASWISPGICVRLELTALPPVLAAELRVRHADQLGADGALYDYGIARRSQMRNRDDALLALALKLEAAAAGQPSDSR